ncbi:MAG: FAD-dependent oxidoreductase [Lachnospiraceae bacterium]
MVSITIDGTKLSVPEGKNVLQCALDNGIYIPHLCHHKDLVPLGSCRMCVVEVEGEDKPVPSCTLKAKEGLVVRTQTEQVTELRRLALELLLTGHPEDCSTCPEYGHCELQMLIQYIGPKTGRLKMRNKGFEVNSANPLIEQDMNRCVLCGRCVRACHKLRGVGAIDYQKREDLEVYTGTVKNMLLADADCRFCQACVEVCPTGTLRDKLMLAHPEKRKEEVVVPCRSACPAHTDIPRYIRYIKEGKYDEAAAVIREKLPFPKSLGYICTHACELECKRNCLNEAMSIRNLKRFAAEQDTGSYWRGKGKQLPDTGKKVCVIGAGPAGLTAAYYLRKQGHAVTVKEALPKAGGMLSYGIPSYRLPREIVAGEVQVFEDQGVRIETGVTVDRPEDLLSEFDAVLVAIGNHQGVRLPIPGSDLPGVLLNIDFLQKVSMGEETGLGKKVVVLGGGNVAFDCARSAKRLGAEEIHVACLEARDKMTSDEEEIQQAQEEGIQVHPAQTFEAITGEDHVTGVDFMNVESFRFDENRRAVIVKEPDSLHHIEADTVIFATGQRCTLSAGSSLERGRANSVAVTDLTEDKSTSVPGVFAAGDCIYGTKSVVMAVESGREAASQIDKYLGGDGEITEVLAPVETPSPWIGKIHGFAGEKRLTPQIDPAKAREHSFALFDHGLCEEAACKEAGRCLQCDLRLGISKPSVWGDYAKEG